MTDKLDEYRKKVEDCKNRTADLRERWENDYNNLWRLKKFQLGKSKDDYDDYTSNEPRALAKKVIEILSYAKLKISIQREGTEEERRLADLAEKFIYGARNLANTRLRNSFQPGLQEQMAFYSTVRGMFGQLMYIHNDSKGRTIVDWRIWDPFRTYWDVGPEGFLWICNSRVVTKAQMKAEFHKDIEDKAKIYDMWDGKENAIFWDGDDGWLKKPTAHGCDHIPATLIPVGISPYIQSEESSDTIRDFAESIYDVNRGLYSYKNKLITYYLTLIGQGVHAPLGVSSAGGKKGFEKSPYQKGAIVKLDTEKGEEVKPLLTPAVPRDAETAYQMIQNELNVGGMSPVAFGQYHTSSGYETSLLISEAEDVLLPRKQAMEIGEEWAANELLDQYASGGYNQLRLHGYDRQNKYFDMVFTSDMVLGGWFPECKLIPKLPEDDAAKHTMAQILRQNKLMPVQMIMDKYLGVEDPAAAMDLMKVEDAYDDPRVRDVMIAAQLAKDGRPDLAEMFLSYAAQQQQMQKPKSPYRQGVPDNIMPKEEIGYTPPMNELEKTAYPEE